MQAKIAVFRGESLMFLTTRKCFSLFLILFLFSCSRNENKKLRITVFNSSKETKFFDEPRKIFIADSDTDKQPLYTVNRNINILEKLRQYDEKHGTKTYVNTTPYIKIFELKPNEKIDFFVVYRDDIFSNPSADFAIFHISKEITTVTYYEYDNYISDMLKNGFISFGEYDSTNKTIYFDLGRNPRKITELAYTDFSEYLKLFDVF